MALNQFGAPGMMPGNGPIRIKKKPGLLQSIVGIFIGLLLILGSPIAMWQAGDQHRADDFESATRVEASSSTSGYITFRGTPSFSEANGGEDCHNEDCIYQKESIQSLVTSQALECGPVVESESVRVLYQDGYEYDEDTGETTPCYQVERDEWKEQSAVEVNYPVEVGSYLISPAGEAEYLDLETATVDDDFDAQGKAIHRSVFTFFPMPSQLLIAGESDGRYVSNPSEKTFVVSAYDDATTLMKLEERDAQSRIGLWIAAFGMLFIGFSLVFGPLEWAARMFGRLPVVGRVISQGSRGLITLVALLLAAIFWVVIWFFVTLIQIWWLGLLFLVVVGGIIWLVARKN